MSNEEANSQSGEVSPSIDALAIVLSHDFSQFLNIDNSQEVRVMTTLSVVVVVIFICLI